MELLHLTTTDAVSIAANYFSVDPQKYPNPKGWVVFLHMMPATKESWNPLAEHLRQKGYSGLAIDLRGHGASNGGPDGFREFSDAEHQDSVRDVDAAIDLLKGMGAREDRIILIGASIGANLALQHVAHHSELKTCVLFSPGLDYHGVATKPAMESLALDKRVLIIGSRDDDRAVGNADDIETLWQSVPSGVDIKKEVVDTGGHGTAILSQHPELIETITTFITL